MFILEGGSISWCSKKEDCFSLSTIKSEYIACTAAVQEAIWLRNSLLCLDVTKHAYETTVIYCDNTAAILFFSTNIIPWAVQRTDHDLLLGEGMYRDKMVGEVGTNTFHSNPYCCGWTRLHAKTLYSKGRLCLWPLFLNAYQSLDYLIEEWSSHASDSCFSRKEWQNWLTSRRTSVVLNTILESILASL